MNHNAWCSRFVMTATSKVWGLLLMCLIAGPSAAAEATGPLRVHPANPRYFTDGSGKAIYLTGWNVWGNLQDGHFEQDGWVGHPFHKANNINGIDGDPDGDGNGNEVHTLQVPAITRLQEAYVRKVIATVNDLDNVLYEVANESNGTPEWQYHVIDFIKRCELGKPKQHPVQMTGAGAIKTADLLASSAEAIGPIDDGVTSASGPPAADGKKVILADTDHLGAIGMDRSMRAHSDPADVDKTADVWRSWIWRSFTRGYKPALLIRGPGYGGGEAGMRTIGDTRRFAEKMDLAAMTPRGRPGFHAVLPGAARPGVSCLPA